MTVQILLFILLGGNVIYGTTLFQWPGVQGIDYEVCAGDLDLLLLCVAKYAVIMSINSLWIYFNLNLSTAYFFLFEYY